MKSLQHIAEAMQANKPLLGSTQEKPHLRESNEGANALVAVEKITAEKVLPRGMKEGVSCLQRFSSETDGLPGLDCGITGLCGWISAFTKSCKRRLPIAVSLLGSIASQTALPVCR